MDFATVSEMSMQKQVATYRIETENKGPVWLQG